MILYILIYFVFYAVYKIISKDFSILYISLSTFDLEICMVVTFVFNFQLFFFVTSIDAVCIFIWTKKLLSNCLDFPSFVRLLSETCTRISKLLLVFILRVN